MGRMEDTLQESLRNAEGNKEAMEIVRKQADRYGLQNIVNAAEAKLAQMTEQAVSAGGNKEAVEASFVAEGVGQGEIDKINAETEAMVAEVAGEKTEESNVPKTSNVERAKISLELIEATEDLRDSLATLNIPPSARQNMYNTLDYLYVNRVSIDEAEQKLNRISVDINFYIKDKPKLEEVIVKKVDRARKALIKALQTGTEVEYSNDRNLNRRNISYLKKTIENK